jgi:hypothetical protein
MGPLTVGFCRNLLEFQNSTEGTSVPNFSSIGQQLGHFPGGAKTLNPLPGGTNRRLVLQINRIQGLPKRYLCTKFRLNPITITTYRLFTRISPFKAPLGAPMVRLGPKSNQFYSSTDDTCVPNFSSIRLKLRPVACSQNSVHTYIYIYIYIPGKRNSWNFLSKISLKRPSGSRLKERNFLIKVNLSQTCPVRHIVCPIPKSWNMAIATPCGVGFRFAKPAIGQHAHARTHKSIVYVPHWKRGKLTRLPGREGYSSVSATFFGNARQHSGTDHRL